MARVIEQSEETRKAFYGFVDQKRAAAAQEHRARTAEGMGLLFFVLGPLAEALHRRRVRRLEQQGASGERELTMALKRRLPRTFALLPNVVITLPNGTAAELDLVVIGASGVYIVEVKTWAGAIQVVGDRFLRREGQNWRRLASPARQQTLHLRRLTALLAEAGVRLPAGRLYPLVVLLGTRWLRVTDPCYPVLDRPSQVARTIRGMDAGQEPLPPDLLVRLEELLLAGRVAPSP